MTTDLTTQKLPAPTPQIAASLSPQALQDHRAGIASEVRVLLSAYFQPNEANEIRDAQLAWWCDELQDWTREQVVYALRQWNRGNPRIRPTPGDISGMLRKIRGMREAERMVEERAKKAQRPEPPRKKPTPEEAREIMQRAGIAVKHMGGTA